MVQSDLRRPERWRGRVQSPFAGWSVFAGAAVAVVLGGLFWASVWIVLRPSVSTGAGASSELLDTAAPSADELDDISAAAADILEDSDVPERQVDAGPATEIEAMTADPVDEPAELVGPVHGPTEMAGPVEESGTPEAVDAAGEQAAARVDEITARAEEIAARAGEFAVRADEFAAKAEELSVRLEGLTARIEELEAKLQASVTTVTARPAVVPSPATTARSSETVAARAGQAASGTRAPWVVLPQPGPGSRVTAGPLALEALARGEASITKIHMVLDGVAVPVVLERRDDTTWRGRATTRVAPGSHTVAVTVVDGQGRTGSYRWQFDAAAQTAAGVTSRMTR